MFCFDRSLHTQYRLEQVRQLPFQGWQRDSSKMEWKALKTSFWREINGALMEHYTHHPTWSKFPTTFQEVTKKVINKERLGDKVLDFGLIRSVSRFEILNGAWLNLLLYWLRYMEVWLRVMPCQRLSIQEWLSSHHICFDIRLQPTPSCSKCARVLQTSLNAPNERTCCGWRLEKTCLTWRVLR